MAKNSGEGYSIACQAAKGFDNVHVINSALFAHPARPVQIISMGNYKTCRNIIFNMV